MYFLKSCVEIIHQVKCCAKMFVLFKFYCTFVDEIFFISHIFSTIQTKSLEKLLHHHKTYYLLFIKNVILNWSLLFSLPRSKYMQPIATTLCVSLLYVSNVCNQWAKLIQILHECSFGKSHQNLWFWCRWIFQPQYNKILLGFVTHSWTSHFIK